MLRRAEQAAAEDPQARPVQQWFARLVDEGTDTPEVGKHTRLAPPDERAAPARMDRAAKPAPGRQTLVMQQAQLEADAPVAVQPPPRRESPRLDVGLQWRMSQAFGFDFSGVSIRRDSPLATGATRALVKDDEVHFREGAYRPGTRDGDWLVAHELAHVVQQRGGDGERVGSRKELEREADRAATLALLGRAAPIALRAQPAAAYAFSDSEDHDAELEDEGASSAHEAADGEAGAAELKPAEAAESRSAGSAEATPAEPQSGEPHSAESKATEAKPADAKGGPADAPAADETADEPEPGAGGEDAAEHDDAALGADAAENTGEVAGGAQGAGGGGDAPAQPAQKEKAAPSVAGAKPEAGFTQLQGVRPDKLAPALGQLHAAATADVGKARAEQRANPPKQLSTGEAAASKQAGAPGAKDAATAGVTDAKADPASATPGAKAVPPGADKADAPVKAEVPGGEGAKQAQQRDATQQQQTAGQIVHEIVHEISSWFGAWFGGSAGKSGNGRDQGGMGKAETKQMSGALDKLPTSASGLSTEPGPAPQLAMQGAAKARSDGERARLEMKAAQLEQQGRADSRVPMGEDHIETKVPAEELTAKAVPGGAAPEGALPTIEGAAASEEVGIVAKEQHGAEIDAALAKGSADVTAERAKHAREEAKARADADQQLRALKTKADADQAAARAQAKAEADKARGEWQAEIDRKGADARRQADKKVAEGMAHVAAEEAKANAEARQHIEEGKRKADEEKQKGEREAEAAKQKGKHKSSGFFGWLSSKAKAFFAGIKKAVSAAIDAARRAVKAVIAAAKKLAMAAIELARKAITAAIKAIGDALLVISEVLLAAFPGLKARFQAAIRKAVDAATTAVNKIADGLKKAVQAALDLLAAALDKVLGLLEKGLHAIVDAVGAVVQGAIDAARAVVEALGTWARLLKDIVLGPGAWIRKLGAAVVDGIKNHLWAAFKTAVLEWFKSKVFELLGVAGVILQILADGGISKDDIIQMALDALIVAIPAALIAILIEKLVAMIVPAAGAVMAIIEGLQAAWGTISRIIAAFAAFMAFLLAVQSGAAGPLFAAALASAAVVLLDFVANWLLKKLRSAARKVGARLKGMAEKLKRRFKRKGAKGKAARPPKDGTLKQKPGKERDRDKDKRKAAHDKRKAKDKNDQVAASRAAKAAARKGWSQARRAGSREIMSGGELRAMLSRAARASAKARVQVRPEDRGDSWHVHADATVGRARASATAGHGWVARSKGGQRFYAASNMASFNRKLIDDALGRLRREDAKDAADLRKAYDQKVAAGKQLERKQQGALDRRMRGLKFELEMESFAGAEKDHQIRTKASIAPNTTERTENIPLESRDFAKRFHVSPPQAGTKVKKVRKQQSFMRAIKKPPMLGNDKLPGYVVNMAATPGEIQPGVARRYFSDAWAGSDKADLAKIRTAVVVGVNSFRSIDPAEERKRQTAIESAIGKIQHVAKTLMAVFGFTWEPRWTEDGKGEVSIEHVRAEWQKLPPTARGPALEHAEKQHIRDNLPYGTFRNEVIESSHTKNAAKLLARVNDPVHVLTQDADGAVTGEKDGIFTEYDRFLKDVARHPLLTIGGYRFSGFQWNEESATRRQQLTELANEIDRAIRVAISKVFPDMLYPTEPNMLIKVRDAKHRDGAFDRKIEQDMFGHGTAEGRKAGNTIRAANNQSRNPHPNPVAYAPNTSPTSSPTPENRNRGLTVDQQHVEDAAPPFDAIRNQAQNTLSSNRLAQEFANAADGKVHKNVRKNYLSRPEELGRELAMDPKKPVDVDAEEQKLKDKARADKDLPSVRNDTKAKANIDLAVKVAREIIATLSSDELRAVWQRLHQILDEIQAEKAARTRTDAGGME